MNGKKGRFRAAAVDHPYSDSFLELPSSFDGLGQAVVGKPGQPKSDDTAHTRRQFCVAAAPSLDARQGLGGGAGTTDELFPGIALVIGRFEDLAR